MVLRYGIPNKGELVWVGGRQEGGKLGELIAYKQNHIFKDWDDVKKNMQTIELIMSQICMVRVRQQNMQVNKVGNLLNQEMFVGRIWMEMM